MRRSPVAILVALALAACPSATPLNRAPTVTAEPAHTVDLGESVVLAATAADPDGDAISFQWDVTARPDGSTPGLTGAQTATASFTPDREGSYTLSIQVGDGLLASEPALVQVTAVKQPLLDGALDVRVVDAATGAPLPGVVVTIEGTALTTTSGADGHAKLTDPALTGAITIHVSSPERVDFNHDGDPATPWQSRLAWRGATLQGAVRAELTVPLRKSAAGAAQQHRGRVKGRIDPELYDLLPEIAPMLSLDESAVSSGQLRAVMITPLADKPLAEIEVSDLMGAPLAADGLLPGNLTTDDPFLDSVSNLLKIPNLGENPLTHFEVEAPAGRQTFAVLGVLISADMPALVPLLTGSGSTDPGAILGSLVPTTIFAGLVELDIPEGGVNELVDPLVPSNLTHTWVTQATVTLESLRSPWPLDPTVEVDVERAKVTPVSVARATTPPALADPRLAGQLPEYAVVEITQPDGTSQDPAEHQWLEVPEETGAPATDVPFAVSLAVARAPGGYVPLGISFTRVGDRSVPEAVFALPRLDGPLAGASVESVSLTMRGLRPSGLRRVFGLLPGVAGQVQELSAGTTAGAVAPPALPLLAREPDRGLDTYVECLRDDTSTTTVRSARAFLDGVNEPGRVRDLFGATFTTTLPATGQLAHVVLGHRMTRTLRVGQVSVPVAFVDPAWDVYADSAASLTLAAPPAPFETGDMISFELRAETFPAPLDMARWSGDRLRSGPRVFSADTWLGYWP